MASKSKQSKPIGEVLKDLPTQTITDLKEEYEMLRASHCLLRASFGIIAMRSASIGKEAAEAFTKCFDSALKYLRDNAHDIAREVRSLETTEKVQS